MRVSRVYKHDYLGMDLDYSDKGKLKVGMVSYPKKMLKESTEAILWITPTIPSEPLFNVRGEKDGKLLDEERARGFH